MIKGSVTKKRSLYFACEIIKSLLSSRRSSSMNTFKKILSNICNGTTTVTNISFEDVEKICETYREKPSAIDDIPESFFCDVLSKYHSHSEKFWRLLSLFERPFLIPFMQEFLIKEIFTKQSHKTKTIILKKSSLVEKIVLVGLENYSSQDTISERNVLLTACLESLYKGTYIPESLVCSILRLHHQTMDCFEQLNNATRSLIALNFNEAFNIAFTIIKTHHKKKINDYLLNTVWPLSIQFRSISSIQLTNISPLFLRNNQDAIVNLIAVYSRFDMLHEISELLTSISPEIKDKIMLKILTEALYCDNKGLVTRVLDELSYDAQKIQQSLSEELSNKQERLLEIDMIGFDALDKYYNDPILTQFIFERINHRLILLPFHACLIDKGIDPNGNLDQFQLWLRKRNIEPEDFMLLNTTSQKQCEACLKLVAIRRK